MRGCFICKRDHTGVGLSLIAFVLLLVFVADAFGRNPYRRNFFDAYPSAVGTVLDDVSSSAGHCGVCHYDFSGGGARNPYGLAVEGTDRSVSAIAGLGASDSDSDGFSNETEITDTLTYINTPTFWFPVRVSTRRLLKLASSRPMAVKCSRPIRRRLFCGRQLTAAVWRGWMCMFRWMTG